MANKQGWTSLTVGDVAGRIQGAWKALLQGANYKSLVWPLWGSPYGSYGSYGTNIDYASEAGDLTRNAIVMTVIQSIMTAAPEAPPKVMRQIEDGSEVVPNHPLISLLKRPNKYYSGRTLMSALYCSYNLSGNAYWLKVRNGSGGLIELWYEPHISIRCRWKGDGLGDVAFPDEWISHYEVYRLGKWIPIPREDVVHFRFGLEGRYGINKLASALREVYTDNEAARYSATVLKNMGVPGVIIMPKVGEDIANPQNLKLAFMQNFQGDKRGEPMVSSDPVDVQVLSFSPEQMSLKELRRLPEERIPALLSWPAVVAGLGAGLDHSTYNNMDEARQQAYEQNIIPTQMVISDTIGMQLLSDMGDPDKEEVVFDLSQVRVLQDDENKKAERWAILYDRGIAMQSEARRPFNLPTDESHDVFKQAPAPIGPPLLPPPPPVLALPAPEKGYSVGIHPYDGSMGATFTKARAKPNRRQAIERAFERDLLKLISRDIEGCAGRLAA